MRYLLLLCLVAVALTLPTPLKDAREKARACILQTMDFNHDGCTSPAEVQRMYDITLSSFRKSLVPSVADLFRLCQPKKQRDQCLTATDLDATMMTDDRTCLPTFTHIVAINSWVCDTYAEKRLKGDV